MGRGRGCASFWCWVCLAVGTLLLGSTRVRADEGQGTLEVSFVPTRGAQLAAWVERADGTFVTTLALTHATATEGIGNRPGALQMNSGYRWAYGRREGVLPVWAHRRASAKDAAQFRRVIYQDRPSEGFAARLVEDQSIDDYFCISIDTEKSSRDSLDAVTCASVFASDKGRFIADADLDEGYAEPFVDERGLEARRALSGSSLYPPRRDLTPCLAGSMPESRICFDHADSAEFARHARSVMPELDAVSRATPEADRRTSWRFTIPSEWSRDDGYVLFVEVNTEGDYNEGYNPERYPSPTDESLEIWDGYAQSYGYPYRGQPSVVYRLPLRLVDDATAETSLPAGYGALHGEDGTVRPLDGTISDDAEGHPGSGADRLQAMDGPRLSAHVLLSASCDAASAPPAVQDLVVVPHADASRAHMWAELSFRTPSGALPIADYEVRVRAQGGEWMAAFTPDKVEALLPVALDLCSGQGAASTNRCATLPAGTKLEAVLSQLKPLTKYEVSVTPRDTTCSRAGAVATTTVETKERVFTTVSPCFVATASYGSPLAPQVGVLRRVRDRYLATHAPGRALIALYYALGPHLAAVVRRESTVRHAARLLLEPVVAAARWLTHER